MNDGKNAPLIALTGGLGSGKSTALKEFGRLGAAVLDCDQVVHELLERENVRSQVSRELGLEALTAGEPGRKLLADRVFSDAGMLGRLEGILHPLVRGEIESWRQTEAVAKAPLAVVEIQMLFEAAMEDMFDALVLVTAEPEIRRERTAGSLPGADFDRRTERQLPESDKLARCGFSYDNSGGTEGLVRFVRETYDRLASAFPE